jgi:7-cyano-7-deazaguanine synthase
VTILALLSGGLDSSTAAKLTHAAEAVFIDYGQRHIREFESALAVAAAYGIELTKLDLRAFGASVRSALTSDDIEVPHGHYAAENMAITVVPNRNAVMLSAAAGIAASRGHSTVVTAVHAGDHAIYPDCRPDFIEALSRATRLACGVSIHAPFLFRTKSEIAAMAAKINVPIGITWSCYEGGEMHCGRCGTCVERLEAIHDAGVADPTLYADVDFWRQQVCP